MGNNTYQTIEPDSDNEEYQIYYEVFEWGEFDSDSVLAGQPSKTAIAAFETVAEAQKAYPKAEVSEYPLSRPVHSVDHLPDWDMSARDEEDYFADPNDY
jgi:hypothetical protein